jgi:hypothetical protein
VANAGGTMPSGIRSCMRPGSRRPPAPP